MARIRDIIEQIADRYPPRDRSRTRDVLQCGNADAEITGIAVVFMPTLGSLQQAVDIGANLIVAHEPLFYGYGEGEEALPSHPAIRWKAEFLATHDLAVWRFHDGTHVARPDLIEAGLVRKLGWETYGLPDTQYCYRVPPVMFKDLVRHVCSALGLASVKVVGDPQMSCQRIGIRVGAPGIDAQIGLLANPDMDVLITGEVREWETCEYARDAIAAGQNKGLVVLGHAESEEPGIAYVAECIRQIAPSGIAVTYLPTGGPFSQLENGVGST